MGKKLRTQSKTNLLGKRKPRAWFITMIFVPSVIAVVAFAAFKIMSDSNDQSEHITRLIDLPKVQYKSEGNEGLFWGTYRPHLFFGLSHLTSDEHHEPLTIDLAWFDQLEIITQGKFNLRFRLRHFGYIVHDVRELAIQELADNTFSLRTEYIKNGGHSWTVKVRILADNTTSHPSLIWIAGNQDSHGWIKRIRESKRFMFIEGWTKDLKNFKLKMSANQRVLYSLFATDSHIQLGPEHEIIDHLARGRGFIEFRGTETDVHKNVVIMVTCVAFPCDVKLDLNDGADVQIEQKVSEFQRKINEAYGFGDYRTMVLRAVSDLIGGIGYFTGSMMVSSETDNKEPQSGFKPFGPFNLLTATPCRSKFPRGFLWDEAFHSFVIAEFDHQLAATILSNYLLSDNLLYGTNEVNNLSIYNAISFEKVDRLSLTVNLMNKDGWIPRELIVGDEASILVPLEFLIQYSKHANPPVWMGAALNLVRKIEETQDRQRIIKWKRSIFDRLKVWYMFLNKTQSQPDGSYMWRGRKSFADEYKELLNPTTLPSGLDDYPRSSHPSDLNERHVDLFSWITYAARILSKLSEGEDSIMFKNEYMRLIGLLNSLHWTGEMYADYGVHTEDLNLVEGVVIDQQTNQQRGTCRRQLSGQPFSLQFIDKHFGYVNLFPIMLQIIEPQNSDLKPKCGIIDIRRL
ncbi:hypothetical protein ACOME3_003727 [Neoechinorhynchus agilis]